MINTATNTVVATVGVGADPVEVLISPDGVHAYVTNAGSNSVSVIDTSTQCGERHRAGWSSSGERSHLLVNRS